MSGNDNEYLKLVALLAEKNATIHAMRDALETVRAFIQDDLLANAITGPLDAPVTLMQLIDAVLAKAAPTGEGK